MKKTLTLGLLALLSLQCAPERTAAPFTDDTAPVATETQATAKPAAWQLEAMRSPAAAGSAEPFLSTANDGDVLLSWLEPVAGSKKFALRFARFHAGAWSDARTIAERDDLFVNWADFPSIVEDGKGTLFAHWLQKSGGDTYAYDVRMASSTDGGATWGEPFLLNRDGRQSEHGFASLVPLEAGGVAAAWLDGRNMMPGHGDHAGEMTLRFANVDAKGTLTGEEELDTRTCECCTTGMVMTAAGPVIVYRDRSDEEIRDISYVTRTAGGWTKPAALHADGWKIAGCPVNGPQIDAIANRAAVAWFTAGGGKSHVYAAFSADGGATFGKPVVVDDGTPLGRVDVVMLDESRALVTWLEQTGKTAEIRARTVAFEGQTTPSTKIADSTSSRGTGFARAARAGDGVWLAWTEQAGESKSVRVARVRL
jgi:hypothetical protein